MTDYQQIVNFMGKVRPDLFPDNLASHLIGAFMKDTEVGEWVSTGGFRFDRTENGLEVSLNLGAISSGDHSEDWTWLGTELEELFKLQY